MAAASRGSEDSNQDSILEPLSFPEHPDGVSSPSNLLRPGSEMLVCLFCSESAPLAQKDVLLKHLLLKHKLVIADVRLIADLPKYMLYWRGRFLEQEVTDFCSVIKTNSTGPVEKQEHYFLLCDVLPEDRVLREKLQQKRLEEVLEQQQMERDDCSFCRFCLFCNEEFTGNRSSLLNHMAAEHSFNIGLPDNIVYCDQYLDTLQGKLDNLQCLYCEKTFRDKTTLKDHMRKRCLYCEKTFRDKTTLKDHMRKKSHRRINASNREYDRFYIINYLELGKTWEEVQSEDDREMVDDDDDDWSDWRAHPVTAVCLFCDHQAESMENIHTHMKDCHGFDLHRLKTELNLRFYQQVKLVNFIRRQVHQGRCPSCQQFFSGRPPLLQHLGAGGHAMHLPGAPAWDQPQYYFPTYENDGLLCGLEEEEEEEEEEEKGGEGGVPVLAEDTSTLTALKQNSILKHLKKNRGTPS